MKKVRQVPSILKPLIDEKAAIAFAETGASSASENAMDKRTVPPARRPASNRQSHDDAGKNMVRLSIVIKKSLYEIIAKDAARKDRTIDDHLKKHLAKHYGK
jgi:hypothetical protein